MKKIISIISICIASFCIFSFNVYAKDSGLILEEVHTATLNSPEIVKMKLTINNVEENGVYILHCPNEFKPMTKEILEDNKDLKVEIEYKDNGYEIKVGSSHKPQEIMLTGKIDGAKNGKFQVTDNQGNESNSLNISSEVEGSNNSLTDKEEISELEENSSECTNEQNGTEQSQEIGVEKEKNELKDGDNQTEDSHTETSGNRMDDNKEFEEKPSTRGVTELDTRVESRVEALKKEGWKQESTNPTGSVLINESTSLNYQIGGETYTGLDLTNSTKNDRLVEHPILNVYLVDVATGKKTYAFFDAESAMTTSEGFTQGFGGSDSATATFLGKNYHTVNDLHTIAIMTKLDANGHLMIKAIRNEVSRYTNSTIDTINLLFENTISVTKEKRIHTSLKVTNVSSRNLNLFFANSLDTKLAGKDTVPIKFLGDKKGLYIISEDKSAFLAFYFNIPNAPDNWSGGAYMTSGTNFSSEILGAKRSNFLNSYGVGQEVLGGDLGQPGGYGEIAIEKVDTEMFMKWLPATLTPDESRDLDYDIGLNNNIPPEITTDKSEDIYAGDDYAVKGKWRDEDSSKVDLYYQIDGENPIKVGTELPNTNRPNDNLYEFVIPKNDISSGLEHNIDVYVVDPDGNMSNVSSIHLKKGVLTFKEAPTSLTFGENLALSSKNASYPIANRTGDLVVYDTRASGSSWKMQAAVKSEFTSTTNPSHKLTNALWYVTTGNDQQFLNGESIIVATNKKTSNEAEETKISDSWVNPNRDGLVLKVSPGEARAESYAATVTWTLSDTP